MRTVQARVRTVAEIELRRRWRTIKSNTGQLLAIGFVLLLVIPWTLAMVAGTFLFGTMVGSGEIDAPIEWIRLAAVYGWLGVAGFGGYRAYSTALRPDNADGLLTTVSHRDVLGGLLLAEGLLWGVPVGVLTIAATVAFALGLGAVSMIPFALGAAFLVLATALATGFVVALLVRNGGVRSVLLTRLRNVFFVLLAVGYFWVIVSGSFASVFDPLYQLLAPTPVGWYADLALLGTDADAAALRAGGSLLFSVGLLAVSVPVLDRLAAWLWYADGVSVEREASTEPAQTRRSRLAGIVPGPVLAVSQADWKRARRAPITLSFALYTVIVLVNPVANAVQTGTIGRTLPLWVLLCGVWITGSLFALNALGSAGATLPVTLLGARPGRALIGGHAFAGAAIGTPLTVGTVALLGALSPHSVWSTLTLTLAALVLTAGAGAVAAGIGVLFPRFDAVSLTRSTKAIVPSMLAFGIYSVVIVLLALPAVLAHSANVTRWLSSGLGTPPAVVSAAGVLLSVGLLVAVGTLSALFAIRRIDSHYLD